MPTGKPSQTDHVARRLRRAGWRTTGYNQVMRPFEILLLVANGLLLLWWLHPVSRSRWAALYPTAPLFLLALHLFWEGGRWQMVPAYGLTAVLIPLVLLARLRQPATGAMARPRWQTFVGGLVGLMTLLVATALSVALPVPKLPPMTGSYPVGTFSLHLVDNERADRYADAPDTPDTPRELMVQFWYPAAPAGQEEAAIFLPDLPLMAPVIAEQFGLPPFILNHANLIRLEITTSPPAADGRFPLILFAHGLSGLRMQNSSMMRELASHGYVVAAMDHTYANAITIFPDGRAILYDPCRLFSVLPNCATNYVDGNNLVRQWADDMAFLLDTVAAWDETPGGILAGKVATERVGVFGHSTGGGATLQFCLDDPRCVAGLGLDAWLLPVDRRALTEPPPQPFLFLNTPDWLGAENQAHGRALLQALNVGFELTLAGTEHFDFSDIVLLSPLTARLGISGEIDSLYSLQLQNQVVLSFFNRYLRLADEDFLERPSPYPELTIRRVK